MAISSLMAAIALAGFNPLGHVLEQLKIEWHRYTERLFSILAFRSAPYASCKKERIEHELRSRD